MLRTIQHPHVRPIVLAGQITTNPVVANIGGYDLTGLARNAVGKVTSTKTNPNVRPGIVVGSVGTNIADGGFFAYNTDPSASSLVTQALGANGLGDDGTLDFLAIDYRNSSTDRAVPSQSLLSRSQGMRWLLLRVAAAGTIAAGGSAISTIAVASSVYTLTFKNAFARTPLVFPMAIGATQKACRVTAKSASAISVATFDSSGVAEDNDFYCLVVGWDRTANIGGGNWAVQCPQRKPRLEIFRVTDSGTAAIALGSTDATLVDNGTGDYTLTWTKAFLRAPIVMASGKIRRLQLATAATTTAANFLGFDATGSAADGDFCVVVVGFDAVDSQ